MDSLVSHSTLFTLPSLALVDGETWHPYASSDPLQGFKPNFFMITMMYFLLSGSKPYEAYILELLSNFNALSLSLDHR